MMTAVCAGRKAEQGFTLVEMLTTLLISSLLGALAVAQFFQVTQISHDETAIMKAEDKARAILDLLAYDLRMTGAGMPLMQVNFDPSDVLLGTAALPVLTTATATSVTYRFNEVGEWTVLTADYSPSGFNLDFPVFDSGDFLVGDIVYLSNLYQGGEDGMRAEIANISMSDDITVDGSYTASAGTPTFASGSVVQRVTEVVLNSPVDWSGITRQTTAGTVTVAPNATFTIDYLAEGGGSIALPMTAAEIANNLHALDLTVSVREDKTLRDGSTYTATASQQIMLRNLVKSR